MTETTEAPPTPPQRACSLAGDRRSPAGLGWLMVLFVGIWRLGRRR